MATDDDINKSASYFTLDNQTVFNDDGSLWSATADTGVTDVECPFYFETYMKALNPVDSTGFATPDTPPPVPPTPPNSPANSPTKKTTTGPPRRPPPPPPPRKHSFAGPSTPSAFMIKANTSRKRDRIDVEHEDDADKTVVASYEVHVNSKGEEVFLKQDDTLVTTSAQDVKGKAKEVIFPTSDSNNDATQSESAILDSDSDTEMDDAFEAAFEEYFTAEAHGAEQAARDLAAAAKKAQFILGSELAEEEIEENKENILYEEETPVYPKMAYSDRVALRPLPLRWKFLEQEDDRAKLDRWEAKITLGELLVFEEEKWGLRPYRVKFPTLLRWSYTLKEFEGVN